MRVRLLPEGEIVDAYPNLSHKDHLLVRLSEELAVKKKVRWESRADVSYEIVQEDNEC